MKRIRFLLTAVACLAGYAAAQAQDDFNPTSPSEPGPPTIYSRIVLLRNIDEAGSVSGAGRYAVGSTVNIYAYVNSGYSFINWTDTKGNELSTSTSFGFMNTEQTDTLIANYAFTPGSPSEPSEPSTTLYYRLGLQATQGCSVSGAGRYLAGKSISVSASVETGYDFIAWTNRRGETVSTSRSFSYTMPVDGDTLTANCVFNPDSPTEPNDPILRHTVTATSSDGGYYSGSTGRYLEGSSYTLTAYANSGYEFAGWYLNGELYTNLRSFSYTVGKENMNFYAQFTFNPSSPDEPLQPALDQYNFYLMTVNATPGSTMSYPMFLASTQPVGDMTFNLTFPTAMMPDLEDIVVSELATGYTTSLTALNDSVFIFSMIGGHTDACTTQFLTFNVEVNNSIVPGSSWQVKINQISLTQDDGNTVTARTRNGRMGVYDWGDASLDGVVDGQDSRLIVNDWLGTGTEELDMHIADIVNDGALDGQDTRAIINVWLETPNASKEAKKKEQQRTKNYKVL